MVVKLKAPESYFKSVICLEVTPLTSIAKPVERVSRSVPQEKVPFESFQRSLEVVAVSQSVREAP